MNENKDSEDEIQVLEVNQETIYQQDRAMVDTQISTAKAFPRSLKRSTEEAIAIVTMDKDIASTCTYALPRGGKSITGPSVHLAKILAQSWGNMRAETKVIDIGPKQITSQAIAFDLEKNLAIKVEVKRSIMTKNGRMNDDMIVMTGNAANAIALRNAIFAVIPRSVVDKVHKAAIGTITGDISDDTKLIAKRKKVLEEFKESYKATEEQVLGVIGKASIDHITREDIVTLVALWQSIKDGDVTVEEAFKPNIKIRKTPEEQANEKEAERITSLIKDAPSKEVLESYKENVKPEQQDLFNSKMEELSKGTKSSKK